MECTTAQLVSPRFTSSPLRGAKPLGYGATPPEFHLPFESSSGHQLGCENRKQHYNQCVSWCFRYRTKGTRTPHVRALLRGADRTASNRSSIKLAILFRDSKIRILRSKKADRTCHYRQNKLSPHIAKTRIIFLRLSK